MPTEVEKLHSWCAEKLGPLCHCDATAEKIRFHPNPLWGFSKDKVTPLNEVDFVFDVEELIKTGDDPCYPIGFRLVSVRALCQTHFDKSLPDRPVRESEIPDKPDRPDSSRRLYQAAMDAYGQRCIGCGQANPDLLQLVIGPGYAANYWAERGIRGFNAKYQFLAEREYPAGLCVIRCMPCVGKLISGSDSAGVRLRARVIEAYGGQCRQCGGEPTDPAGNGDLWLVRKPGAAVLRHPGGKKVASKDKYRRLAGLGFPDTHELLCRTCWKKTRSGGGFGDPT